MYKSANEKTMLESIFPKPQRSKYDNLRKMLIKRKCAKQSVSRKTSKQKQTKTKMKMLDYSHLYGSDFDIDMTKKLDRYSMKVDRNLPQML